MGRRKVEEAEQERRTRMIGVHVTPSEYSQAEAAAKAAGLLLSEYGRQRILNSNAEVNPRDKRDLIRTVLVEYTRIGTNINQIAFLANRDQRLETEQELRKHLDQLSVIHEKIMEL
jgi:hypothetical protein